MAEYIEREAAKRKLVSDYAYAAANMLDEIPSADVVEVVRCKDCNYWVRLDGDDDHYCRLDCGLQGIVAEEDFCSYGERRDNDE